MFRILALAAALVCSTAAAADKFSIVVVSSATPTAADQQLAAALNSQPVAAIAAKCNVFEFQQNDPLFRAKYGAAFGQTLPAVALIRSDGGVIYKTSGANIPDGNELARRFRYYAELDRDLRNGGTPWDKSENYDCPDGKCPNQPQPLRPVLPWRDPERDPNQPLIPDTVAIDHSLTAGDSATYLAMAGGVVLLLVLGGGLLFFVVLIGAGIAFLKR